MGMWSPWRGCRRHSDGCKFCYIHKGDAKRGVDTGVITRTENFYAPIAKKKNGDYKIRSGDTVYVCFSADFLIEEADQWRDECWEMMRERDDLHFLFLTKRIERFMDCIPSDWKDGYDNVTVGCTVEDQRTADMRLPIFSGLPIRHKNIIAQPLIGPIDMSAHLKDMELVVVGGEQDKDARPLDHAWVLDIREQCECVGIKFQFRQCGTYYIKDGMMTTVPARLLCSVAKKAGIDL
jgi:protein gp37